MPSTLCFSDFTIIANTWYELVGGKLDYYGFLVADKRENIDLEIFIYDAKISQKMKGYEHEFHVDDFIRNYDENQVVMRKNSYSRIVMTEAWRRNNNPLYVEAFHEV